MSGIQANVYIEVKDHEDWEKLYDMEIDEGFGISDVKTGRDLFGDIEGTTWSIDDEWSPDYSSLSSFLWKLCDLVGRDRIIYYAEIWFYSSDEFNVEYYFGGMIDSKSTERCAFGNLEVFLKYARIKLQPREIKHICSFKNEEYDFLRKRTAQRIPEYGDNQNRARLFIAVKNTKQWEGLKDIDLSNEKYALPADVNDKISNMESTTFMLEDNWHIEYGTEKGTALYDLIKQIIDNLGKEDCILLADCADPNKELLYTVFTYFGDKKLDVFEAVEDMAKARISDPVSWMKLAQVKMSGKRKSCISEFPDESLFLPVKKGKK